MGPDVASVVARDVPLQRVVLRLWGLEGPRCAARIAERLSRQEGVLDARVDAGMSRASVFFDPRHVGPERLVDLVWAAGTNDGRYAASLIELKSVDET